MSRLRLLALPLLLVASLAALGAAESFEERATRQLRAVTRGDLPGVAVLVAREGKVVFQGGFGYADLAAKRPIGIETRFRIGSLTKQFTAMAVLKLAESGKLALADPLEKYFPGFPNGDRIALRHLLTHTSGLHSHTDNADFLRRVSRPIASSALIAEMKRDKPDFAPGAQFRYNNTGYFLLGEIVAQVSGKPYGTYLRETFFTPLSMQDTGVYDNAAPPAGMAVGYAYADGVAKPARDWDMSWAGGAGNLYSTVGDLFKWTEALFAGRVVDAASLKAATTPVELPAGAAGLKYGYGLLIDKVVRLPAVFHDGIFDGWLSYLLYFPEQRCVVAVLGNSMPPPPNQTPGQIAPALAQRLLADEIARLPALAEDRTVDPATFRDYVGEYDYGAATMVVTTEGDALYAQLGRQARFRIFPRGGDAFFWKAVEAEAVFVRDAQGRVTGMRHTQNGHTFTAPRKGGASPASR